jgi:hypothetical protein
MFRPFKQVIFNKHSNSQYSNWLQAGQLRGLQILQAGSVAHPASYSISTGDIYPGDKAAGAWGWLLTSNYGQRQEIMDVSTPHMLSFCSA